jgi:hypothetical protein
MPKRILTSLLVSLLAASPVIADFADFGPGTAAWNEDLAALEAALEAQSPDLETSIQTFCQTHRMGQSMFRLQRAAGLFPVTASGRSDPDDPMDDDPRYRIAAIATTPYTLKKYGEKLEKLLPKVASGAKTLEWARKRAARSFRMGQIFTDVTGCEIADIPGRTGVMIATPDYRKRNYEIFRLSTWNPDRYKTFKSTWQDLHTRIVLNAEYQVIQLDQHEPTEGYRSLLQALRYIGEIAPRLPADNSDEWVFVPGDA